MIGIDVAISEPLTTEGIVKRRGAERRSSGTIYAVDPILTGLFEALDASGHLCKTEREW